MEQPFFDELQYQLEIAERFQKITQQLGFVLWQVQALEGAAAVYFVLLALAKPGMGLATGMALETKQKKTDLRPDPWPDKKRPDCWAQP